MSIPAPTPNTPVWSDYFMGAAGAEPNPDNWIYQTGEPGAFGNDELETYVNSTQNCYQDGKGHLILRATEPSPGVYHSARLVTQGRQEQAYGTWDARIKFTHTEGLWPAWWLMGNKPPAQWPSCGEVDVFEEYGVSNWSPQTTVWFPSGNVMAGNTAKAFVNDSNWHAWRMTWLPSGFTFYKDGTEYFSVPTQQTDWPYVADNPMYMILNLAVGGTGGGDVGSTTFPSVEMMVDYVRVWSDLP
jgi:beta-glucanase (GH16 family)